MGFINLTEENIYSEHLCCIIRNKPGHEGIEAKRQWLPARIKEGHVFRKLDQRECVFIEYAPLETAWVPIVGENYYYIYCLWVQKKGNGYGKELMEYCIADAKENGKSGICMLGSDKQKNWLSDQKFAQKYGFNKVDSTGDGYNLLALSFDKTVPKFSDTVKQKTDKAGLTVFYDYQCPYIPQRIEKLREYCTGHGIPAEFVLVDSLEKAKNLPCVFNNWAAFYDGKFISVNQLDASSLERFIRK